MDNNDKTAPRVIVALAYYFRTDWRQLRMLQQELFAVEQPVAVKLAYYGTEGTRCSRPLHITTNWLTDPDRMVELMDKARAKVCFDEQGPRVRCVEISSLLQRTLDESEDGPIQAVIVFGNQIVTSDSILTIDLATQLGKAGTKLFFFESTDRRDAVDPRFDDMFRSTYFEDMAKASGGAYIPYHPQVESLLQHVPKAIEAIGHYATGDVAALEAMRHDNKMVWGLLNQMKRLPSR
jgi:hypothetical protein